MKKYLIFVLVVFSIICFVYADSSEKKLTPEMIDSFEQAIKFTPEFNSIMNALKSEQYKNIFYNWNILKDHNDKYVYEIDTGKITDQKGTGRCWLYAALNTIRPYIVDRLGMKDFKFSANYYFFWDKMEKANYFLEKVISKADFNIRNIKFQKVLSSPVGDGGYWQNAVDLVKKYGAVPASAMPEVASDKSSRTMVRNLTYLLRNQAFELKKLKSENISIDKIRKKKKEFLNDIYRILVLHLGRPVKSFLFRYYTKDEKGEKKLTPYKEYTPRTFAKEFVLEDMDKFVMFANWPGRDYYKLYEWEGSNNVIEGTPLTFINLPMNEIKNMMIESIKNNIAVNFSADVGKQLDRDRGIMNADLYRYEDVYNVRFSKDKKVNTMVRNINSTHAMVFLGVDIRNGKPVKWKVENSWGTDSGNKGFYAMYDNWVDLYVVRVVIDKKFVPDNILKILKTKPIVIPEIHPEQ